MYKAVAVREDASRPSRARTPVSTVFARAMQESGSPEGRLIRQLCYQVRSACQKAEASRAKCEMLQDKLTALMDNGEELDPHLLTPRSHNFRPDEVAEKSDLLEPDESEDPNEHRPWTSDRDKSMAFYHLVAHSSPGDDLHIYQMWMSHAQEGELDIYTTFCLAYGNEGFTTETINLLLIMIALLVLQLGVPVLMLLSFVRNFGEFEVPKNTEIEFRVVGVLLFLYSVWLMYFSACDECRSLMLNWSFKFQLPLVFVWPLILGDLVNAVTSCMMVLALFTVYIERETPAELLIDCVAMNFLGTIDNEVVGWEVKERAVQLFCSIIGTKVFVRDQARSNCSTVFESCTNSFVLILRVVGTLGLGHFMAFVFLIAHEPWAKWLCDFTPSILFEIEGCGSESEPSV